MTLGKETVARIRESADRYPSKQSAILPALWAVQHEQGYVTPEAMQEVAQHLGLPPSLVEATSSFYSMYLTKPEGRHEAIICVNVSCSLRGADELVSYCEQRLGIKVGQTTADGAITLRSTIECLGGCGGAPMMQLDHRFEENVTPERADAIFEQARTAPAPHEELPAAPEPRPKGEPGASGATRKARPRKAET